MGSIVYPDMSFEVQNSITTLEVKQPNILEMLNFESCYTKKSSKNRDIFEEVCAQAIASKHFPVFLLDGQSVLMFDFKPGSISPVIDQDSNIHVPFEYYKVVNTAQNSKTHYTSNSMITPQMLLLLSILEEDNSESRVESFVKLVAHKPRQIKLNYDRLLDISKNGNNSVSDIKDRSLEKVETPPLSASSEFGFDTTSVINSFKAYAKQKSKRIYINEVLPVLEKFDCSIDQNSMVTLVVDTKEIQKLLKIDLPLHSEKVIMKLSSIDVSHAHYNKHKSLYLDTNGEQIPFESFLSSVYHDNYLNELAINLYIDDYNQRCLTKEEVIRKPAVIGFGELICSNYRGFYMLETYLNFINNKPKSLENKINGLKQLKILHGLNIVHRDLEARNLCVDSKSNNVHLIDFGHSCITNAQNRSSLEHSDDSMMTEIFDNP